MGLIEVKNITKRFDDKIVLDNISLSVDEGDIFGLIGPNGAGKTTLIKIMTGLWDSNDGEVIIDGYDIKKEPLKIKEQIGLVPQEIALFDNISAYDNLEFFGYLYGLKGKFLKKRINEALELIGLEEKRKEKVGKFSGGMKRRLNVACAILHEPRILIMDEPTVGIDPQSRNLIFEFIRRTNKEKNTTVIYTSHYMEEVEMLCNNIFIIDLGQEVAYGNKKTIKSMISNNDRILLEVFDYRADMILAIKSLAGVNECIEEKGLIKLLVDKDDFRLEPLLKVIEGHNGKIKSINFEEPSLEEVFLALTGKNLRD
ncbi:MAG: ABC transporter ATP-binding protein [Tissierellia bacterium]|nr:ABC transporter ATP-binding protein [Tissierellia bacterium]